jgi:hypothetical protein
VHARDETVERIDNHAGESRNALPGSQRRNRQCDRE